MILYFLFIAFLAGFSEHVPSKRQVIIDADTANEVDDPYAIVRAFAEPNWEVLALNATQVAGKSVGGGELHGRESSSECCASRLSEAWRIK